jgi:Na+/H+-translocating membrane pyrophosphatase
MMTGKRPSSDAGGPVSGDADEIAEMKRQMAELQAKLDRLGKV